MRKSSITGGDRIFLPIRLMWDIHAVGFSFYFVMQAYSRERRCVLCVCVCVDIFMRSFQPRLSEEQMRRRAVFLAAFQGLGSSQTCMCALIAPPAMFQFPLRQICPLNANVNGDDAKAGKSSTELQRSESEGTLSKPRRAQRCLINSASHPLSTYLSTHTSPPPPCPLVSPPQCFGDRSG